MSCSSRIRHGLSNATRLQRQLDSRVRRPLQNPAKLEDDRANPSAPRFNDGWIPAFAGVTEDCATVAVRGIDEAMVRGSAVGWRPGMASRTIGSGQS